MIDRPGGASRFARPAERSFFGYPALPFFGRGHRWPWSVLPPPPDSATYAARHILLASEGRKIPPAAVEFAANLAKNANAQIHVLSIARIWGSAFGLPHPGLMPNSREWKAQHDLVAEALAGFKRRGLEASGQVLSSRNAGKRILAEARRRGADAIVMAADGPRHWIINDMIWSQEPYRIRRLAPIPVYLVESENVATHLQQPKAKIWS
jgi:nucleotide-binding universal stress UspA family protein